MTGIRTGETMLITFKSNFDLIINWLKDGKGSLSEGLEEYNLNYKTDFLDMDWLEVIKFARQLDKFDLK